MPNLFGTEKFKTLGLNVLPILKNHLRLTHLISNQYDPSRVNKDEGSTITIKRPVVFRATEFSGQIVIQDINRRLVDIQLNTIIDVSFELSVEEMTFIINNNEKKSQELLQPAFAAIADDVDERIAKLWKEKIPFYTGDPSKPYDHVLSVLIPRKNLVDRRVPRLNRRMLLATSAYAELSTIDAFLNLEKSGTTELLKEANLGHKFGFDMYETEVDLTHIVGDGVTGAAADITLSADSTATLAPDNNDIVNAEFNTMKLAGLSATGTVKAGELLTISQGGKDYQFVVKKDVVAVGGKATVETFPVYRTLETQQPITFAANSVLNFAGKDEGSYEKSIAYQEQAFAFVPVALPNAGILGVQQTVISAEGISFRMTGDYDIKTKRATFSVDMLAGFAVLYPELAQVVIGGQ